MNDQGKGYNLSKITPTKGFVKEEVVKDGLKFIFWDLSGEKDYRGIWKNYTNRADIIILAIDGTANDESELEDLAGILKQLSEINVTKLSVIFTKSDKNDFKMLPGIDVLTKHKFKDRVFSIEELSYKDPNLSNKIFGVIRFGSE
jgi:GTPase SAR1 family protein